MSKVNKLQKKPKLGKVSADLLKDLEDCAMSHGWQQDQGTGSGVAGAKANFDEAHDAMTQRLLYLEGKVRSLTEIVHHYGLTAPGPRHRR